ncbi:MAG: sigma-70 family RNA polymerase sigma factor [Chthoniobacteraceae bacterium]
MQALFLTHMDIVRGFIRSLVPDRSLADDVLQETFLTVTRKAADFVPETNFVRWSCTVARYKVLEARRSSGRAGMLLSEEAIEALSVSEAAPAAGFRLELLRQCMEALTPAMRQVVDLRYQGDHKPGEIAARIGWTPEAVYVALSRARSALRACVNQKLHTTEAAT